MSEMLDVAFTKVEPGKKVRKEIKVAELTDSSPVNVPIILINGRKPGPRLCLAAAYHGDEYNGIEVAQRLANKVNPEELSGGVGHTAGPSPRADDAAGRRRIRARCHAARSVQSHHRSKRRDEEGLRAHWAGSSD